MIDDRHYMATPKTGKYIEQLLVAFTVSVVLCACHKEIPQDTNAGIETQAQTTMGISADSYYWCDGEKVPLYANTNNVGPIMKDCEDESPIGDDKTAVHFFKTVNGSDIGITDVFSVQINGNEDFDRLKRIAEYFNLTLLGENKFDPSIYYLSCTKTSKGNALEMSNYMYESGLFEYSTPEFIINSEPVSTPDDSLFFSQWNLENISYPNCDIDYIEAISNFEFPYIDDIIVAVVDNGIYKGHKDLPLCEMSYDAHKGTSPSGLYGGHGTLVAGVIGATSNNTAGIAGIASGVKIMDVSICYTEDAARLGISQSTTTNFADAIRYAANKGAHVINNSWEFDTSSPIPEINKAIKYAHEKDCIVVFAAGNDAGAVSQPADGAPDATLVVGAINSTGHKATFSNYGSSLDIVAPGVSIMTTTSTGGYKFANGTSFAAPHVSGIAAMLLAEDSTLTPTRVRNIMEQSARKVGDNEYLARDVRLNGAWNRFYGYGLVNMYSALSSINGEAPSIPYFYPELARVSEGDLSMMGLGYDKWNEAFLARGSGSATCHIEDDDSDYFHIWTSTLPPYEGCGSSFTFDFDPDSDEPTLHTIECRAIKNGYSTTTGIHIAWMPADYSY